MSANRFDATAELTAMLGGSDNKIDLMRAALCIATHVYPELQPSESLQRIAKLAQRAQNKIDSAQDIETVAKKLCGFLYTQIGFSGNKNNYYDPDNSCINRVLETRQGIPISLALVYISVGEALGLLIEGIGFPGHFLIKVAKIYPENEQGETRIIDPFSGQVLDLNDCKALFKASSGNASDFKNEYLKVISKRAFLQRMLRNLKAIYLNNGDYAQALRFCDQLLLLDESSAEERLQRAFILEQLECFELAAQDIERVLKSNPALKNKLILQQKITKMRSRVQGKIH